MKSQQMQVGEGGACENRGNRGGEPLSQQTEKKTGHLFPPLLSLLVMGREEGGGAEGPDSAK